MIAWHKPGTHPTTPQSASPTAPLKRGAKSGGTLVQGRGWNLSPYKFFCNGRNIQPAGHRGRRPLQSVWRRGYDIPHTPANLAAQPRQNRTQRQSPVYARFVMPRGMRYMEVGLRKRSRPTKALFLSGVRGRFLLARAKESVPEGWPTTPGVANGNARAGMEPRPYRFFCNGRGNPARGTSRTPSLTMHHATSRKLSGAAGPK